MTAVLVADQLGRYYGQVVGLNELTTELPGGVIGLVGPNGAGKSTLLRLIVGEIRPSRGSIRVLGQDPFANRELYRRLGFCPQQDALYEDLTGYEVVNLLLRLGGYAPAEAKTRAERALERLTLTERMHTRVRTYSKGMRQRVRLAQAIAHDPQVLVLDEPLNGLDPLVRAETIALFRRYAAEGRHVILSSHVLQEVDVISDQVILIANGMIVAEGEIRGVREEISDHPSQFIIRCPDASRIASLLFNEDHITEVRLNDDRLGLLVLTRNREEFSRALSRIALSGHAIDSVIPADENVDALYEYLIGGGR